MNHFVFVAAVALVFAASCKKETTKILTTETFDNGPTDSLRINQIQVIASHNSYHLKTDDSVFDFMFRLDTMGFLPSQYSPTGIDYSHLPFEQQFDDYGVRGLEIDFYNDPVGGQYYYRKGRKLIGLDFESHIPELLEPGFKIIHIPDFDYRTNYYTFVSALKAIYNWSVAHPNHLPIFINIETKEESVAESAPSGLELTPAIPFDASACDKMDEEIKSVFGENLDKVITPDDVRGSYSTLEEAALAKNWPQLAQARNKVVFIMQGPAESLYKSGHPSLQGRAMFVYGNPGTPEAAFVIYNDPVSKFNSIRNRVAQGYIVRTRADDGTTQARVGDYTDMNASFNSWAQIVSTDYYKADPRAGVNTGWTDYHVKFPNGELVRIDSVSAADKLNLGLVKE